MAGETPGRADFGFRQVDADEKQDLVNGVFDRVAGRYDLMNDLMSGGMHRLWKRMAVDWLAPPRSAPYRHLDVAGGTGDIAFRVLAAARGARSVVCDINPAMIAVGEARADGSDNGGRVHFAVGNAEALPFPDRSFDAYTIAFGIRNVTRREVALAEARRVLRPGGRFLCLEFSEVVVPLLDRLYAAYSFNVIPALGGVVAGDADAYRYLVEGIRQFPRQPRFAEMVRSAGFSRVDWRNLSGGIAAIHSGWRL